MKPPRIGEFAGKKRRFSLAEMGYDGLELMKLVKRMPNDEHILVSDFLVSSIYQER